MDIQAKHFGPGDGRTMRLGRMTFIFKMSADDTEGAYTVMEAVVPPDSGSGLHRHWSYDEAAFVTRGEFECYANGEARRLRAGESIYWPRGAVHKFRCIGAEDGRIQFVCSPGRIFEQFIADVVDAHVGTGSATSGPAVDFRAVASRYGIEFVA